MLLVVSLLASAGCNAHFVRAGAKPASAPAAAPPPGSPKSVSTGVGLAVAGSILPAVGFGVGLALDNDDVGDKVVIGSIVGGLVLPSLGFIYANRKTSPGVYPRAAALATLVIGALVDGLGDSGEGDTFYGVTAVLYGAGCIIDIALTPGAVRDYNERRRPLAPVTVVPTAVRGGAGLSLVGAF
jgi:hypothetical protein